MIIIVINDLGVEMRLYHGDDYVLLGVSDNWTWLSNPIVTQVLEAVATVKVVKY